VFYFIEHKEFRARKVGIANAKSDRLETWLRLGWVLIYRFESEDGSLIMNIETNTLRWIRNDLGLRPFLGTKEMGRFGGGSETFSLDGISNSAIKMKIEKIIETLR
jgi:hypothetical protein